MIAFDTVVPYHSGRAESEQPLSDHLAQLASDWGLTAKPLKIEGAASNLLIESPATVADAPWYLFDSHLDTVGVDGMTIPPFEPRIEEGRLYGRGACDTKGTGAAMFWALRQYAQQTHRPNNIALLFSVGEEHVQLGARAFVVQHLPTLPWRPTGVVVGEPTLMNVLAATGGFVRWTMVTLGAAAHSSRPERGHNAVYDMARVVTTIVDRYLPTITAEHPLIGQASAALTVIRGGQQVNVIPPRCEATFDRRLVPGEDAIGEVTRVRQMLEELATRHPGMQVEHTRFESAPPMATLDEGRLAQSAAQILEGAGIRSQVTGELYTTNGNHFAAAGIPTIVAGPGDIAQAHTPDEWIELKQLELGARGYLALMNGL